MTSDGMRQAFRRVLAREAGTNADKGAIASATCRLCDHFAHRLSRVVGDSGVTAIYARSLNLARQTAGSAATGSVPEQDDLIFARIQNFVEQQDVVEADAAAMLVLTSASEVLTSVVGKGLATRLLQDAWPDDFGGDR